MARKTVNVAMIGAQFMGKAHSNAWRKVDMFFDLPVKPVMKVMCGKFPEELATAEKYGWEETSLDWKEVVHRDDIDIIDICTPNFLHPIIAIEAAKAGKHIVCEKPLANTLKEAKDMLKAAEKANVKHMCGFSYRFAPAVQSMKKLISSGGLGEIYHFRAAYQQDWIMDPDFPMVWRLKKKHTGSGALGDIGAHITDLCHFLVGPVGEVTNALRPSSSSVSSRTPTWAPGRPRAARRPNSMTRWTWTTPRSISAVSRTRTRSPRSKPRVSRADGATSTPLRSTAARVRCCGTRKI